MTAQGGFLPRRWPPSCNTPGGACSWNCATGLTRELAAEIAELRPAAVIFVDASTIINASLTRLPDRGHARRTRQPQPDGGNAAGDHAPPLRGRCDRLAGADACRGFWPRRGVERAHTAGWQQRRRLPRHCWSPQLIPPHQREFHAARVLLTATPELIRNIVPYNLSVLRGFLQAGTP